MEDFNWGTTEYPCLGVSNDGLVICFSSYGIGHIVEQGSTKMPYGFFNDSWAMVKFKPYEKPKERVKLWYWYFKGNVSGNWQVTSTRFSEQQVKTFNNDTFRKVEFIGFIYDD